MGLLHLFFPERCLICDSDLHLGEELLCSSCVLELPLTYWWHSPGENPLFKDLRARSSIKSACSLLHFHDDSSARRLLHGIKYDHSPMNARKIGFRMIDFTGQAVFQQIDALSYVPLHRSKYIRRGYNQSLEIAKGISKRLKIPIIHVLERRQASKSLTRLNRMERIVKSDKLYTARPFTELEVMLIDDVITSGATILSCSSALLNANPSVKINILSLAHARKINLFSRH